MISTGCSHRNEDHPTGLLPGISGILVDVLNAGARNEEDDTADRDLVNMMIIREDLKNGYKPEGRIRKQPEGIQHSIIFQTELNRM
jgi:hypothetical protein